MVFSLRIVTTDHYMSAPIEGLDVCYNEYRGCDVIKVPVVRIYGVTPAGQKSCVHVHGVFPYLYILYDGTEPVERYLRLLTSSIDKALNIALGRASSSSQHVYKVSLVSGITFYGFHDEEQVFVKIYLYNPLMVKKVSDLLLGGAIMNKVFQPYESHIPYQLQMFIDYNLYGMNMLNAAAVKFRRPLSNDKSEKSGQHFDFQEKHSELNISDVLSENSITTHKVWDLENIPTETWLDASVKRQSTCMLEVDVVAADILNRLEVGASIGTNPGLAAIWEDERQRRQEKGDLSSITPPDSPERCDIKWTSAKAQLQNQLEEALQNLELVVSDTEDSVISVKSAISENHPTPSSEVDLHMSRQVSELSTSLVISEEDEDAVVDEESIHQIVMSSQSFTASRNLNTDDSQRGAALDNSLVQLLASLANSESPTMMHGDSLEDHDALLSQHTVHVDGNDREEEEVEELEMSQRFTPDVDDDSNQPCESSQHTRNPALDIDLQGMDQSWNNSQWLDVPEVQSSQKAKPAVSVTSSDGEWYDDDNIPQLDGPIDVKGARHQGLTESSRRMQEQRGGQTSAIKAETFSYSSKKGGHFEKEYINGGVSTGTKLDLRSATSAFVKVGSSSGAAASISPKKPFQISSSSYKPKSTVIDLSSMTVTPVKQTVSLLGARPVVKEVSKNQAAESKVDGTGDERSTAADPEPRTPEKESSSPASVQQNNSPRNAQTKSPNLVIRPGQLVPEKTCRSRRMRLPVVPESCKIDLRSIMSPSLPPRPTASTKAKMKDWAAAMTSMDRHVYSGGKVKGPIRPPNSRTMYSPVDSMMEQVVPTKSLKTYIPPTGIRTSKQNSTMPSFKDPGMIVDAALKAEGKENTKKPANRIYRKHVSGIIPKEDPKEKRVFRQQSLSDLPACNKVVDRSLTDSEQCRQSKQLMTDSDVKYDMPSDVHGSTDIQERELKHGQHSKYTTEEIQNDTENGEIRMSKGGEKRCRKQRHNSEDGETTLETNSSPERNNIFSVVTLEVPGANSHKRSKSSRHSEQQKKALDEKSAAKIVKGLLGFKKNLLSGKSQEELKKIQEKLSGMPGSKNAPVILDDEEIGEGFSSGNVMTEEDYSMQLKIRKRRRRRRRLSSRSNKSHHTTGSEKDISDPDNYIIKGRRDSDSSADSDASLDLKTHVGAHQKTYEKPSYRVGDNFGKKPDSTFDKVVSKTSDGISRTHSVTDSENDTKSAIASLGTLDQKLTGSKHATSRLSQPSRRKYAKSKSSDNDEEKQHSWLMQERKSHLQKGESRFSGLVRKPSKIPRRKPLTPGRIRITSTSPLRYCHGRRRSLILSDSDLEVPEECCTVQVLKDEYDEYISELLGKECVILAKMTDKEVEELKKQVKREMEHKRTEHIMPLVMQKTREEIEKEYEEVKRRVLEEMAKEPPMPDYVDSDEEFFDSDSEKSGSEGVTEMNTSAKPVTEEQQATPKLITVVKNDPSTVATGEEEMPVLEQAVGVNEPVTDSLLLADNLTVIAEGCNPSGEVFDENIADNVTFVIMSQEEAVSEGVLVTEQAEDLPQPIMAVDFDSASQQIIDVGRTANGKGLMNVNEEAWNEACPQDSTADDQVKDTAKADENKILQRDTEMMKSVEAKPGRSSLDMPNDKGEMTEVDFSLLEMDTDNEAHDGSLQDRDLDTHKQLHTPPIMIDSDQSEDNEILVTPKQEVESQIVDGSVLSMPELTQDDPTTDSGKGSSLFTVPVELVDTNNSDEKSSKKRKITEQGGNIQVKIKVARTTISDKEESSLCTENEGTSSPTEVISDMRSEEGSEKQSPSNGSLRFHLKPCFVKVKRLVISGTSVIISDDQKKGKWPLGSGIGGRCASYTQSIMTDVVTENSVDPLWEAHKQRLAVMTQPSRLQTARRQKGPPRHLADYVIPDGTLPTAPKKPSPRKKIRDPFVRSSSGRRAKKRTEQRKFLDKLSILHQYTLDSLSTASETGDGHTSGQSEEAGSGCSNVASATASPVTNVPKPVAGSYANDARDDHSSNYDDVMYKLALLSPEEQAVQDKSMPQPTSPTQGEPAGVPPVLDLNDTPRHESAGSAVFVTEMSLSAHTIQQEVSVGKSSSSTKPSMKSQENQVKEVGVPYTVKTEVVRIGSGSQPPATEKHSGQTNMGQLTLEQSPSGISKDRVITIMEMEMGTQSESCEKGPHTDSKSHVKPDLSARIDTGHDEQLDSFRSTTISEGKPSSQEPGFGSGSEDRSTSLTYTDHRMSEDLKSLETERAASADSGQQMICEVSPSTPCTSLLEPRVEVEENAEQLPTGYRDVSPPVTLSTQPISPCSLAPHRSYEPCETAAVQSSDRQQAPCHSVVKEQSVPDEIQPPNLSTDQQLHDQAQEISVPTLQDCSASEELPSHISRQPSSLSPLYYSSSHSQTSQVPRHSATSQSPYCSPKQQPPAPSPKPKTPPHSPEPHSLPPSHTGHLPVNSAIPLSEERQLFQFPLHSSMNQSPPRSPLPQSPPHSSAPQVASQSPATQTFTGQQPSSPHSPIPSVSIQSPPQTITHSLASSPQSIPHSTTRQSPSSSPSHRSSPRSAAHSPLQFYKSQSPPHSPSQQATPLSPCPQSPQLISPPRSPSPIRSPDPHRPTHHSKHDSHMPAVIPLNIEDPIIQEEVEKARRVTLMKLLGHSSPKLTGKHQWPKEQEGSASPEAVSATMGQSGDGPCPEAQRTGTQSQAGDGRVSSGSSLPPSGSGQPVGDGEQFFRRLPPGGEGASDHRLVVQPLQPPPSREALLQTAQQYALGPYQAEEVCCSNPEDVPDRPRDLGGKLLKIASCLVSDLPDACTQLSRRGVDFWKDAMMTRHLQSLDCSQACVSDLLDQVRSVPHLREAFVGDRPVVLTPCRLPPRRDVTVSWLKGKELYRMAKREAAKLKADEVSKKDQGEAKERGHKPAPLRERNEEDDEEDRDGAPLESLSSSRTTDQPCSSQPCLGLAERRKSVSFMDETPSKVALAQIIPDTPASITGSPYPDRGAEDQGLVVASTPIRRHANIRKSLIPDADVDDVPCTPIRRVDPEGGTESAGSDDSLECPSASHEDQTDSFDKSDDAIIPPTPQTSCRPKRLSFQKTPTSPSLRRVLLTTQLKNQFSTPKTATNVSQIDGPTPKNSFGFKMCSHNIQDAKALHEYQYLTVMSLELHIQTRGDLRPDPEFDAIRCIFYSLLNDVPSGRGQRKVTGLMVVDEESAQQIESIRSRQSKMGHSSTTPARDELKQTLLQKSGITNLDVTYHGTEEQLILDFVQLVRRLDPDILVGYEIQMLSWGYIIQRSSQLGHNITPQLSRVPEHTTGTHSDPERDPYGSDHMSEIHVDGRIVINLWRILRHEVTLNVYTFENCLYHILHRRAPLYRHRSLTEWFDHRTHVHRWRTIEYYIIRCRGNIELMEQIDLIGQTSEFARVFGIEFYHVLSRGTQYRVESMMLRIAKPMNYIPVSPNIQQRSRMRAPECIPLNLEPESNLYTHPVLVLDFQSLYPSIMIAYNYCYSTCLGRLEHLAKCNEGPFEFGCTSLGISPKLLKRLKDDVTICPNGVVFVRQNIKKGILPRMVEDILKTRLMVKKSMADYKDDKTLQRLLHSRQLGLKLIANVTFGYTSANYSGRMPCVEIGDSIVRKARETLERAIELVENTSKWGAKVVYGDTDSMFVLLEGRTKEEAFRIGKEIAEAVTSDNPKPIKLKFEKVYLPCVLQTKKRYVGFMYESVDQKEPVFDAKGIETVRRDNCAAVSKILEKSIKTLFVTRDISTVKRYVQRQCQKLIEGRVSVQDCVFAKEYRGLSGYRPGACVPALCIAKNRLLKDRRSEPRVGERVSYVIVCGTPGLPLIQLVREPQDVLDDPSLRINFSYYITKQILPPLDRIFSLLGLDVQTWYKELPRVLRAVPPSHFTAENKKGTISQYFSTLTCPVCEETTRQGTCQSCRHDPQRVAVVINSRISNWQRTYYQLVRVCNSCMGCPDPDLPCRSLDCPILYRLTKASRDNSQVPHLQYIQKQMLRF